jgi:hypothetical protein
VKRRGGNGAPPSILIDRSAGPESGESADVADGEAGWFRGSRGGARLSARPDADGWGPVVRRSVVAAGLLALVGAGLPAVLHGPTTVRYSGVLDPYPTAPGTT